MTVTQEHLGSSRDKDILVLLFFFEIPTLIILKCKYDHLACLFNMLFYMLHAFRFPLDYAFCKRPEAYYGTFQKTQRIHVTGYSLHQ